MLYFINSKEMNILYTKYFTRLIVTILFVLCVGGYAAAQEDVVELNKDALEYYQSISDRVDYGPNEYLRKYEEPKSVNSGIFSHVFYKLSEFISKFIMPMLIGIIVVAIVSLIVFLILKIRINRSFKANHIQEDECDDIYSRNLESELKQALSQKNYNNAIKVLYLIVIKQLNDSKCIKWSTSKTSIEYYYEIDSLKIKEIFKKYAVIFLDVRYGNVDADNALYEEALNLKNSIFNLATTKKGGVR